MNYIIEIAPQGVIDRLVPLKVLADDERVNAGRSNTAQQPSNGVEVLMVQNQQTAAFLARVSAKLVDGTIVLMAVLGSLSYSTPGSLAVIATVFASLLAVALAHAYAETINEAIRQRRVVPLRDLWPILAKQLWVMSSIVVPIAFFGLAVLRIISQNRAFRLTEIALIILLFAFGFVGRRVSGGSMLRATSYGTVAVVLGLMLVEIKQWAKYLPEVGQ